MPHTLATAAGRALRLSTRSTRVTATDERICEVEWKVINCNWRNITCTHINKHTRAHKYVCPLPPNKAINNVTHPMWQQQGALASSHSHNDIRVRIRIRSGLRSVSRAHIAVIVSATRSVRMWKWQARDAISCSTMYVCMFLLLLQHPCNFGQLCFSQARHIPLESLVLRCVAKLLSAY